MTSEEHPITAYRRKKGLTLEALADKAGMSKSTISRIEAGKRAPTFDAMTRLERATGGKVTANQLVKAAAGREATA